jgi:hypothetical protein
MFLKKPELTAGSRPTLSQDETLLSVQDGVGLYEGWGISRIQEIKLIILMQ